MKRIKGVKILIFSVLIIVLCTNFSFSLSFINEGKKTNFIYSTNFLFDKSDLNKQSFIKEINYNNNFGNFNFQNYGVKLNSNKKFFFFFDIKDIDFINKNSLLDSNNFSVLGEASMGGTNENFIKRLNNFSSLYIVNNTYNFNTYNLQFSSVYNLRKNIYLDFSTSIDINKDFSNFSFSNKGINSKLRVYIKF